MIVRKIINFYIVTECGVLPEYDRRYIGSDPLCFIPAFPGLPWNIAYEVSQTPHQRGQMIYVELFVHGHKFGHGRLINRRLPQSRDGFMPCAGKKLRFYFPSWTPSQERDDKWNIEDYKVPEWMIEVKVWQCKVVQKLNGRPLRKTAERKHYENTGLTPSGIFDRDTEVKIVQKRGTLLGHLTWFYRLPEFFYGARMFNELSVSQPPDDDSDSDTWGGIVFESPKYHRGPDFNKKRFFIDTTQKLPRSWWQKRPGRVHPELVDKSDVPRRGGGDPIPVGWEIRKQPGSPSYFVDHRTQQTTWTDPRDKVVHNLYMKASAATLERIRSEYEKQQLNYPPACLLPETLPEYTKENEVRMVELLARISSEFQRYQLGYNMMDEVIRRHVDACTGGTELIPDKLKFMQLNREVLLDNKQQEYLQCLEWLAGIPVSTLKHIVMTGSYAINDLLPQGVLEREEKEKYRSGSKNSSPKCSPNGAEDGWCTDGHRISPNNETATGDQWVDVMDTEVDKSPEKGVPDANYLKRVALRSLIDQTDGLRKFSCGLRRSEMGILD